MRPILLKEIEVNFFSVSPRGSQRVPEEESKSEFNGKVAQNNGLDNGFFQFSTSRDRFRDICQKPPENARVVENKPIEKR